MNDRELLELAAKAAGIELDPIGTVEAAGIFAMLPDGWIWDPLHDDGDAFRLMVKLRLWRDDPTIKCIEKVSDHDGDACAATRRAIVRAAAALGERKRERGI